MADTKTEVKLEDIVSLCKRRGFIYPGSEIYGGLAGTYDYGPLGVTLKRNITSLWWKMFVESRDDMYGIDSTIIMNPNVWVASGHVATFNDPLIEDVRTKKRYRLDHLLEAQGVEDVDTMSLEEMAQVIKDRGIKSPDGNELGAPAQFNMMFKTHVGPVDDDKSLAYLRPETAQGMFTNFRNVVDSLYPDLPFGLAQIGRSFRNEISPGNFIFRLREFEIMEFEYFIDPKNWEVLFEDWLKIQHEWFKALGLDPTKIKEHEVPAADRAHYSKRTVDCYYDFPSLGFQEIVGLAYRTDYDLTSHQEKSGKSMEYRPKDGGTPFVPHVLEPTFGLDRHVMAVLCNSYWYDTENERVVLKLPYELAPIKIAVCPLAKNNPELVAKARSVYESLKREIGQVVWIDSGNIGKNYRKMDEIGVPYVVTVDFETLEGDTKDTVTVRNRDTTEQSRSKIINLIALLSRA